ncbi:hypothetical protein KR026_010193, partial [Drosophila bipectinata]
PENLQSPIKVDPKPASAAKIPQLPIKQRERSLLPPNGGCQRTSNEIYEQIIKNMLDFPQKTTVTATVMNRNIADNCFFVAKWGPESKPIQKLLEGQVPLEEVDQLPDYGDIFAVYDCTSSCIPRVAINAAAEDGTYEAYLVDYGEHIRLMGNETIFLLPDNIKKLPAEAVKCHLTNGDVDSMSKFVYQDIEMKILDNNGIDLVVELLHQDPKQLGQQKSTSELDSLNDSAKDSNNNLTSKDATNDGDKDDDSTKEFSKNCTKNSSEMGSTARMLVTYINGPTEVYAQFMDGNTPLVWDKNDIPEEKRTLKSKPYPLDIVLALYSDGCYYRAQIVDEMDDEYKIFYVDYGNTEFVPLHTLAPCPDAERLKPHRANSCHIEGVVRSPNHRKGSECVEFLKSKLLNMEVDVKLIARLPDGFLVRLLNDYSDVPHLLIKRGYAH